MYAFCKQPYSFTWGKQSGRDSKITSRTPIGTVTCSSSRFLAIRVLRKTRPTLSCEEAAICRSPMARLFSLDVERLKRFSRGPASLPEKVLKMCIDAADPSRLLLPIYMSQCLTEHMTAHWEQTVKLLNLNKKATCHLHVPKGAVQQYVYICTFLVLEILGFRNLSLV